MRGPLFQQALRRGEIVLRAGERIEDFETLYTIIIQERQARGFVGDETDERIALISLCGFTWPGKTPRYQEEIREYRRSFRGITDDPMLQVRFRGQLSDALRNAQDPRDLRFERLRDIFEIDDHEDPGTGSGRGDGTSGGSDGGFALKPQAGAFETDPAGALESERARAVPAREGMHA